VQNRVILFAGKFEEKKRPRDLLEAFMQARLPEVSLLMVGNGEQETALRRDYARANIYFAPFQNQSRMPRVYMAGDVFVLPSYGNQETWGLAVSEAMCMGRPIIVSDHVGCARDLVQDRKNGLIFPAGNVSALANALREAFADTPRLKSWGECSHRIIQGYSYASATRGLKQAMDFVLRKNALASAA
jgi:glycosyltransferase involved in cell wall biosynthesis